MASAYWALDTTYHPVIESFSPGIAPPVPVVLADGSVLAISGFGLIAGNPVSGGISHLNADGSLDSSYKPWMTQSGGGVFHVYSDNRILAPAYGTPLARLTPQGTVDPSFTAPPLSGGVSGTLVLADGHILAYGVLETPTGNGFFGIIRLGAGGTIDPAFSTTGVTFSGNGDISSAALQSDGKILVYGLFTTSMSSGYVNLARLNADGSLDTSFTPSAVSSPLLQSNLFPGAQTFVTEFAGGEVIVGGGSGVVAFKSNGAPDASYVSHFPAGNLGVFGLMPDGRTYFEIYGSTTMTLGRLNPDGTLDAGFSGSFTDIAFNSTLSTWDGTSIYIGSALTSARSSAHQILSRLNSTGVIDAAFSPRFGILGSLQYWSRQADGRYIIMGDFAYVNATAFPQQGTMNIARLNNDGSLDTTFGIQITASDDPTGLLAQPDGHVLLSGYRTSGSFNAQVNADGTIANASWGGLSARSLLAVDATGLVYAGNDDLVLSRFNADGTQDTTFTSTINPRLVAPLPGGRCFVIAQNSGQIMRLSPDGSVDAGFAMPTNLAMTLEDVCALQDGSVIVAGTSVVAGAGPGRIVHLNASGAADYILDLPHTVDMYSLAGSIFDFLRQVGGSLATSIGYVPLDVSSAGQAISFVQAQANPFPVRILRTDSSFPSVALAPTVDGPADYVVADGSPASTGVDVEGLEPFSFQWYKDGAAIAGATSANLTFAHFSTSDSGSYTVTVTNAYGSATTAPAAITDSAGSSSGGPILTTQPASQTAPAGSTVTLTVGTDSSANFLYQWYFDGTAIPTAVGPSLILPDVARSNAGTYYATVTLGSSTVSSSTAVLTIATSRLTNISARAFVGTGSNILIAGYSISGTGSKLTLVRGVGPGLTQFGVGGALGAPQLTLFDSTGTAIGGNSGWSNPVEAGGSLVQATFNPVTHATFGAVGAFDLPTASADSALSVLLPSGQTYTAEVAGTSSTTGTALAEIYDEDSATSATRITNLSSRAFVGTGSNSLIAGFGITGPGKERVLIRAVGPSLSQFSVTGTLTNPTLTLFDSSGSVIAANSGWGNPPTAGSSAVSATLSAATGAIFSSVGAFSLTPGSADSAIVAELPPGMTYTAQVASPTGATGVALVEVYEIP